MENAVGRASGVSQASPSCRSLGPPADDRLDGVLLDPAAVSAAGRGGRTCGGSAYDHGNHLAGLPGIYAADRTAAVGPGGSCDHVDSTAARNVAAPECPDAGTNVVPEAAALTTERSTTGLAAAALTTVRKTGLDRSLLTEGISNLNESFGFLGTDTVPEVQEHLKSGMTTTVEELKTERLVAIEMAGLLHSEDCSNLLPS